MATVARAEEIDTLSSLEDRILRAVQLVTQLRQEKDEALKRRRYVIKRDSGTGFDYFSGYSTGGYPIWSDSSYHCEVSIEEAEKVIIETEIYKEGLVLVPYTSPIPEFLMPQSALEQKGEKTNDGRHK